MVTDCSVGTTIMALGVYITLSNGGTWLASTYPSAKTLGLSETS